MNYDYRNNIDDNLNLKNLSVCKDLINQNKTKFISKGLQGEIFKVKSNECGSAVVKKKLLRDKDNKWKNNEQWMKEELEVEYRIMMLTNRMIKNFICPNFIRVYDYNENIPLIIMEYADGDSKFLCDDMYIDTKIYKSFLCQILITIYAFNNYTFLNHRDVKLANILYKKINKDIIFHFKINDKNYYIPTYGYLFMLADYGTTQFKLGYRLPDIINFKYNVALKYISTFAKKYPKIIDPEKKNLIIKLIENPIENKKSDIIISKIEQLTNSIKNIKDKHINDYVFDIFKILSSDTNILKILDNNFDEFTQNKYPEDSIVHFTIDF
jgi:serine/threonine protein kinase